MCDKANKEKMLNAAPKGCIYGWTLYNSFNFSVCLKFFVIKSVRGNFFEKELRATIVTSATNCNRLYECEVEVMN